MYVTREQIGYSPSIDGPAPLGFSYGVVHWDGNPNRTAAPADMRAHCWAMNDDYETNRGYSLGYNWVVVSDPAHPHDGYAYEARGFTYRNAANKGDKVNGNANGWTFSIQLCGDYRIGATDKAAATVRGLFAALHDYYGSPYLNPVAHSYLDWTACCGDLYRADIAAGRFHPDAPAPLPPPTPPPLGDDEMRLWACTDDVGTVWLGDQLTRRPMTWDAWQILIFRANLNAAQPVYGIDGNRITNPGNVPKAPVQADLDALGVPIT